MLFLSLVTSGVIISSTLFSKMNEARAQANLAPLVKNDKLDQTAKIKACDMSKRGYFSHNTPEGISSWHLFDENKYCWTVAGENLAKDMVDEEEMFNAFMNSPKHKAVILNNEFYDVGIAKCGHYTAVHFGSPCYRISSIVTSRKAEIGLLLKTKLLEFFLDIKHKMIVDNSEKLL